MPCNFHEYIHDILKLYSREGDEFYSISLLEHQELLRALVNLDENQRQAIVPAILNDERIEGFANSDQVEYFINDFHRTFSNNPSIKVYPSVFNLSERNPNDSLENTDGYGIGPGFHEKILFLGRYELCISSADDNYYYRLGTTVDLIPYDFFNAPCVNNNVLLPGIIRRDRPVDFKPCYCCCLCSALCVMMIYVLFH